MESRIWRTSCGDRSGSCSSLLPLVRGPFDRIVEKVTDAYAALVRRIATRRMLTMTVVGAFAVGIVVVQHAASDRFYPR